jgi:hypothetical protein
MKDLGWINSAVEFAFSRKILVDLVGPPAFHVVLGNGGRQRCRTTAWIKSYGQNLPPEGKSSVAVIGSDSLG